MLQAIKNAGEQVFGDEKLPKYERVGNMEKIEIQRGTSVIIGSDVKSSGYWENPKEHWRFVDLITSEEIGPIPQVMLALTFPEDEVGVRAVSMSQHPVEVQCFLKGGIWPGDQKEGLERGEGPYEHLFVGKFDRRANKVGTLLTNRVNSWDDVGQTREFDVDLGRGGRIRFHWTGGGTNSFKYRYEINPRIKDFNRQD